jgi:lipoate-protein ligase A
MTLLEDNRVIRRLPASDEPAAIQLAGGPALLKGLEQTGVPAMRWYRITPPALLLGSSQRPHEADLAACVSAGVTVHRRGSGGGVVLSDEGMLSLDLALPREHPLAVNDVTESYRWFGDLWAAALRDLGLDTLVVPVVAARADAATLDVLTRRVCFGALSPYEVTVGRRKLVGLAQIRRRAGMLFQAGVYLRWEPWRTAALVAAAGPERAALAARLAERVTGLDALCGVQAPDIAAVTAAVEAALARRCRFVLADDDWRDDERAARMEAMARYAAIEL